MTQPNCGHHICGATEIKTRRKFILAFDLLGFCSCNLNHFTLLLWLIHDTRPVHLSSWTVEEQFSRNFLRLQHQIGNSEVSSNVYWETDILVLLWRILWSQVSFGYYYFKVHLIIVTHTHTHSHTPPTHHLIVFI